MSTLNVQPRDAAAKARKLRKAGVLPMALVQRDHTTHLIQAKPEDLLKAMKAADGLGRVTISINDAKPLKAVVRKIEKDFHTFQIIHVVLQEVGEDDVVRIDVSVIPTGSPQAVIDGTASLLQQSSTVKVKGKMSDMPDHFEVDVSHLEAGHAFSASDLALPDALSLLSSPDSILFTVSIHRDHSLVPDTDMPTEEAGEATAESAPAEE